MSWNFTAISFLVIYLKCVFPLQQGNIIASHLFRNRLKTCKASNDDFPQKDSIPMAKIKLESKTEDILNMIKEKKAKIKFSELINDYKENKRGRRVFEDTVKYPTEFTIKVIGENSPSFAKDIRIKLGNIVNLNPNDIMLQSREASGGKYISLTLNPVFKSADEIYSFYEELSLDKRVKFVL